MALQTRITEKGEEEEGRADHYVEICCIRSQAIAIYVLEESHSTLITSYVLLAMPDRIASACNLCYT